MYRDDEHLVTYTDEYGNKQQDTIFYRRASDYVDFLLGPQQVLNEHVNGKFGGYGCASITNGVSDWTGNMTLEQSVKAATLGWPEGRQMIEEAMGRMKIRDLLPRGRKLEIFYDTHGDEVDIDRYLLDEPEQMYTMRYQESTRGKIVSIVLNRSASCGIDAANIARRGTALYMAVQSLIMMGYSPEIMVAETIEASGNYYEVHIPILNAGDPINLDTLAFWLIQPSVLRRLMFAFEETESREIRRKFGIHDSGGYGCPTPCKKQTDYDLCIDQDRGEVRSDELMIPYALAYLRAVGIELSQEQTEAIAANEGEYEPYNYYYRRDDRYRYVSKGADYL